MSVGNISPYIFGEFACTKLEKADDIQKTVLGIIGERFIIYYALCKICHFNLFTFMTWGYYKCNKYIQQYVQM